MKSSKALRKSDSTSMIKLKILAHKIKFKMMLLTMLHCQFKMMLLTTMKISFPKRKVQVKPKLNQKSRQRFLLLKIIWMKIKNQELEQINS